MLDEFITLPIVKSLLATALKALQVSVTKLKSLVGVSKPNFNSFFPDKIWEIIVGMTALELCLGPYVLNGLIIVTGVPKLF